MSMEKISPVVIEATIQQRTASDPLVSSWVGASAGSGKTKVLTDRILRLLLPREDGSPASKPDKILALTFTKAGANEMSLRLSKRLSLWAVMDEDALAKDMEDNLLGRAPKERELTEARKLFTRVVDTPGGLNIMTIHSFCQSILGRFPIEAGLPPNFTPLEEERARILLNEAKKDILSKASTNVSSPLAQSIARISTLMTEDQFSSLLQNIMSERGQMAQLLKRTFGIDGLYTNLCQHFQIRAEIDEHQALLEFCTPEHIEERDLRDVCAVLACSKSVTDQKKATNIQAFLDAPLPSRPLLYNAYKGSFLTAKNEILKALATKGVLAAMPQAETILLYEANRILSFEEERKAIACVTASTDLFRIGDAIVNRYQSLKESQGVLDFDDLILRTLSLLKGEVKSLEGLKITPWVMYKLDGGLEHILVDEAQDTNPEQWEIIRLLSDDFFDGLSAKETVRTIFVVGDEKQSIFGFQRAAPEKFGKMYDWFEDKIRSSGEIFKPVNINTSFRSVQIVLDAVDAVFTNPSMVRGLSGTYLSHIAKREGQSGVVELWPILRTQTQDEDEAEAHSKEPTSWFLPDKIVESQSGSLQMAAKIGDTIKSWRETGEILESYGRPIQPGDIMVLVRARNAFVGQLVRALKSRKIPVSGVDRMVLADQLVVQDLCAAAAFALLPDDDLTLACLLKSPLIGWNEDQLYTLAYGHTPHTLWNSLKQSGDTTLIAWLETLITRAGSDHPYEFFSHIVQEPCPANEMSGMQAIRTRLGEDAMDPFDEFLNSALTYTSSHTAGLQGFLQWHQNGNNDIKRQMDEGGGAVRIMTVHGSKGLQAPIIFLPDTVRTASSVKTDKIFWPQKTGLDVPFYISAKDVLPRSAVQAQQTIEQKMDEEYRRLLYVAMTRAEERLYIGGYTGKKSPGKDGKTAYWYDDIHKAMDARPDIERIPSGMQNDLGEEMPVLRLSSKRTATPDKVPKHQTEKLHTNVTVPLWVSKKAPAEPFPPRPLVPSRPSDPEPAAASPLIIGQDFRFIRGTATHKLLQILPDLPKDKRAEAARHYLARPALKLPQEMQTTIASEVMAILNDASFGDIFGEGSIAEVPVTGFIHGKTLISGQIDRILIRGKDILIIDYKTNRPPPLRPQDVPPVYLRQMKAYADTLQEIYPTHTIRCALLWTDGARLMEITV